MLTITMETIYALIAGVGIAALIFGLWTYAKKQAAASNESVGTWVKAEAGVIEQKIVHDLGTLHIIHTTDSAAPTGAAVDTAAIGDAVGVAVTTAAAKTVTPAPAAAAASPAQPAPAAQQAAADPLNPRSSIDALTKYLTVVAPDLLPDVVNVNRLLAGMPGKTVGNVISFYRASKNGAAAGSTTVPIPAGTTDPFTVDLGPGASVLPAAPATPAADPNAGAAPVDPMSFLGTAIESAVGDGGIDNATQNLGVPADLYSQVILQCCADGARTKATNAQISAALVKVLENNPSKNSFTNGRYPIGDLTPDDVRLAERYLNQFEAATGNYMFGNGGVAYGLASDIARRLATDVDQGAAGQVVDMSKTTPMVVAWLGQQISGNAASIPTA